MKLSKVKEGLSFVLLVLVFCSVPVIDGGIFPLGFPVMISTSGLMPFCNSKR